MSRIIEGGYVEEDDYTSAEENNDDWAPERRDNNSIRERLEKQKIANANRGAAYEIIPGVELITEQDVEEPGVTSYRSDDPKIKSAMKFLVIILVAAFTGVGLATLLINTGVSNLLHMGEAENTINESQEVINAPTQGTEIASPREVDRFIIPEGGSAVEYIIHTEGDINAVSLTYIDANGETVEEKGLEAPWNIQIGMKPNVEPIIAAATSGEGKVLCTVKENGRETITNEMEGENPTVQCGE